MHLTVYMIIFPRYEPLDPDELQSYIYNRLISDAQELSYLTSQWSVQGYMHTTANGKDMQNLQR